MIRNINTSQQLSPLPINIKMFGYHHHQEPINRPHGIMFYQWLYCEKGEGEFIVGEQRSVIREGQGMLIYADLPHIYRGLTTDFMTSFIGFEGSLCADLLRSLHMEESGVYSFSSPDIFLQNLRALAKLYQSNSEHKDKAYSTLCYRLLLDLSENITKMTPSEQLSENDTIRQIIFYLEENYASDISLNDLADRLQLSKEYLCAIFKQSMGQTIMHYLKILRIIRAKIFLHQYPEKKTLEIAKMCGFRSPSYFGKVFKDEVGMTPEMYRKRS